MKKIEEVIIKWRQQQVFIGNPYDLEIKSCVTKLTQAIKKAIIDGLPEEKKDVWI